MRTKHFSRLFLFDSDHGNQSLSLPLTFLLCSELNNCIIADFTGQLFSLPSPSPLPVLNPLHYSHVSAFNPRAPSCHSFSLPCFLCSAIPSSFTPPLSAPPPLCSSRCHADCFVRHPQLRQGPRLCSHTAPVDLLKLYEHGHIQGDGWPVDPFLIWPLSLMPCSTWLFTFCHFTVRLFLIKRLFSFARGKTVWFVCHRLFVTPCLINYYVVKLLQS